MSPRRLPAWWPTPTRARARPSTPAFPVVELLPPQNILVRFFVPETELATMHVGDRLAIGCDGCAADLTATVTFISPQPEYTPPVIYSETNREKLVYLIEAHPSPASGDPAQARPASVVHPPPP